MSDVTGVRRIAVLGGIYSNWLALEAVLADAHRRGAEGIYCLGDLGAFGPHPDRVWPLLTTAGVRTIQGNYEESLSTGSEDCNCGYVDPRDNHFAQLSYDYTRERTSTKFKRWMGQLPRDLRMDFAGRRLLLCHGSPRRVNEFLWESSTSTAFLERLCRDHATDVIVCTHTGIPWHRRLSGRREVVNVGAVGRPPNDGRTESVYALLSAEPSFEVEFVRVPYDHERMAREMRDERLPEEFIETVLTGWWTTCLEILPIKERERGRY